MNENILNIPKVELHIHFESVITPTKARELAKRNHIFLPESIFGPNESYAWKDFFNFIKVYDVVAQTLCVPEDYTEVAYDYLMRSAKEGVIYTEFTLSPEHAAARGIAYNELLSAFIAGIEKAKADYGIEARIIMVGIRHSGIEQVEQVAKTITTYPCPYVVGFGLAGDETIFQPIQFAKAFQIAHTAGLQCTAHAGEIAGPESVWATINSLPISRIGHGVRAIEDMKLIEELIARELTLEVCPSSNVALHIFPSFKEHPLRRLYDLGVKVTLNSDDPYYFHTTIGHEYQIAKDFFNMNENDLRFITKTAIENSFAEEPLKKQLLARIS